MTDDLTLTLDETSLSGAKGGGSSHTPTDAGDDLHSNALLRVVDLISEGEIRGPKHGFDNIAKDIYYNETPVENEDGSFNFANVVIDSRSGTQAQDHMAGFPSVESELLVNLEVTDTVPWVQQITNLLLSAVRVRISVPQLQQSNQSNGDITGYAIAYVIEVSTDGGSFVLMVSDTLKGTSSGKYERSTRVNLPAATANWTVRVRRTTPNQHLATVADTTTLESYTEIIDAKMRYPNSAYVGQIISAKQFNAIPSRAFDMYGRIIQVPANYDPITRAYATAGAGTTAAGTWDGTFKAAWTNNPAWIYYDIVTHLRYGLGKYVTAARANKWQLYQIAQYCDVLVNDGKGGLEPRFTCTLYFQTSADANRVLNDLTSVFRGMPFWAGGQIQASADMPQDPDYTYSPANIVGDFVYQGSGRKTRYTVALVSWNDPDDFGRPKVAYVPDREGIARYGVQEISLTSVGATSAGQAQRAGLFVLYTSRLETETCSFTVGLDGTIVAPGRICRIADPTRAGRRTSGRISSATATAVTVDALPAVAAGDTLTAALATGVSETRTVLSIAGKVITVSAAYSSVPLTEGVWAVESSNLQAATFRVLGVADTTSGSDLAFTITALLHNPSKFAAIDDGALISVAPISFPPLNSIQPPPNVLITSYVVIKQGIALTNMRISWDQPTGGAVEYNMQWRRDDGAWVAGGIGGTRETIVEGIYTGAYLARVAAISANGNVSLWAYSNVTQIVGKTAPPPPPVLHLTPDYLQLDVTWDFPITVNISDTAYTEIVASTTDTIATATPVATPAYPTSHCIVSNMLPQEMRWVWGRLVDKSGNIGPWSVAVSAASLSTAQFFQPALDAAAKAEADAQAALANVGALTTQVNADSVTLHADINTILANDFPLWAGDSGALAGDDSVLVGRWTVSDQVQDGDKVSADLFTLIGAKTADGKAFILDGDTVQVSPTQTLSQKFSSVEADAASGTQAAVDAEATARADADSAMAQDIQTLGANINDVSASVFNEQTARVSADSALSSSIDSVSAATGAVDARVDQEILARTTADDSITTTLTSQQSNIDSNTALIITESNTRASADSSLSTRIDSVSATASNNTASINTEVTARASGDSANATSITNLTTTVNGNTASIGTLNSTVNGISARWGVVLDVNGYISGVQQINAGGVASFAIVANQFSIVNPGGTDGLTWTNGIMVARRGSYMKVTGQGFGVNGDLIEWYGAVMATSSCSKTNAIFYMDSVGDAYFGGSLSAGILKNSAASSQISNVASVDTGAFGTNGKAKTVVGSISYNSSGYIAGNVVSSWNNLPTNTTITLYRSYNGGAFNAIGSIVVTGSTTATYDTEFARTDISVQLGGSVTVTDNLAGTLNFDYVASLSASHGFPATFNGSAGSQRTSVISTES